MAKKLVIIESPTKAHTVQESLGPGYKVIASKGHVRDLPKSQFGIDDRIGYSINGGHPHCQLPESQFPEVEAFIDRFLLGKNDVKTAGVLKSPFEGKIDLTPWIKY